MLLEEIELNSLDNPGHRSPKNMVGSSNLFATTEIVERDETEIEVITSDGPDETKKAYMVVLGSFLGLMTNLGLVNSIGAIQAYVSEHQLAHVSTTAVSWVFSVYLALAYSVGLFTGSIFDKHGALALMVISCFMLIAGYIGMAFSKEVYQFILSFILLGVANGISMTPCISVLTHWFPQDKLGRYQGLATSAGSVGGLAYPLLLRYLYPRYGFTKSIFVLGFTNFGFIVISSFLVKEKFKREETDEENSESIEKRGWKQISNSFNFFSITHFKDLTYDFLIAGGFFCELSLVLIVTYFSTYVISQGYSESTAYLMLAVWNATGILGRWIPGYASDVFGKFNVNILMLLSYTILIFALWYPCGANLKALYAFASLGGFFSGSILTLLPSCLGQITKVVEFGERYGILNFFLSIGTLVGVPIGASIINSGSIQSYNNFVLFTGALSAAGTTLWVMSRSCIVGFKLNSKI